MSDIKIQPSATGSATVTLTAPVTNTARTITFPDSTSTLLASDGSAANLTSIPAANITGTLPAISGASLTGLFDPDGAVTINESGADVDFRVESDNATHALFVDGANGNVGINTSSATSPLTVNGEMHTTDNLGVGQAPAAWRSVDTALDIGDCSAVFSHTSNYTYVAHNWYDDGTDKYKTTAAAAAVELSHQGDIQFKNAASGSADAAITWSIPFIAHADGRAKSQFTANAWCAFNAQTPVIRDSHNVSSLTDQATGWFYVNIDVNLANANSSAVASGSNANNTYRILCATAVQVVGSVYVMCSGHSTSSSVAPFDPEFVNMVVFGD